MAVRRLTPTENEAMETARGDFAPGDSVSQSSARYGFRVGFAAGVDYERAANSDLKEYALNMANAIFSLWDTTTDQKEPCPFCSRYDVDPHRDDCPVLTAIMVRGELGE